MRLVAGVHTLLDRQGYEFSLDGRPVTDVVEADEEAGTISYYARHWQTGDPVLDVDGKPEVLTACGKVEVKQLAPSSQEIGFTGDVKNQAPQQACPLCGGYYPQGGYYSCCWAIYIFDNRPFYVRRSNNDLNKNSRVSFSPVEPAARDVASRQRCSLCGGSCPQGDCYSGYWSMRLSEFQRLFARPDHIDTDPSRR